MKPRLLDVFCGGGGAARGYQQAGFHVTGVDLCPQPRYIGDAFVQADALEFLRSVTREDYVAVHASPPCQKYSATARLWKDREHPDLIAPVRAELERIGLPYVMENVPGAPLVDPVMLCGSMFGLGTKEGAQLRRHRLFEMPWFFGLAPRCQHNAEPAIGVAGGVDRHRRRLSQARRPATIGVWGNAGGASRLDGLRHYGVEARKEAMGISWLPNAELVQAIPPAFTCWIGKHLRAYLESEVTP